MHASFSFSVVAGSCSFRCSSLKSKLGSMYDGWTTIPGSGDGIRFPVIRRRTDGLGGGGALTGVDVFVGVAADAGGAFGGGADDEEDDDEGSAGTPRDGCGMPGTPPGGSLRFGASLQPRV